MKISDYLTHIDNPEDLPFLRTKLFDVNIRLFKSNPRYRDIIEDCCHLIKYCATTKMDGYKLPHGMSGANVGIPFNIIGIVRNRGTDLAVCDIMINPKTIQYRGKLVETESNCGSIRLEKSIKIKRYEEILVEYYDIDGEPNRELFNRHEGSFTIQHEIDHNLGILITDRQ